jgi:hypothetical protein
MPLLKAKLLSRRQGNEIKMEDSVLKTFTLDCSSSLTSGLGYVNGEE